MAPIFNRFDICEAWSAYAQERGVTALTERLKSASLHQESRLIDLSDNGRAIYGRLEISAHLETLLTDGSIEECPSCGGKGAYWWGHCDEDTGLSLGVKHIGCHSGMGEWECPHCQRHLVARDSPLLAECYTHVPPEAWDEEDTARSLPNRKQEETLMRRIITEELLSLARDSDSSLTRE